MRVNHVGEVCAQALYSAQALTTRESGAARASSSSAAREETDHLAWTRQRLRELGHAPSLLNPLWYAGAFGIGLLAGRAGDAVSLGFVVETERQVEAAPGEPSGSAARRPTMSSRAIVEQMKDDEARARRARRAAGAATLPLPVRWAMRAAAKVMTTTAHYI